MSGKAHATRKKPQQMKRSFKQTANREADLSENEVGNTAKRSRSHARHLSSKVPGQAAYVHLKRVKISSNKRTTWQPLSKNTEEYLKSMMESIILGVLFKVKRKEQIQYHLNQLKKRLLQQLATLKVPPSKLNYLTDVSNMLKMEKAQERANEESLALLQEEIDKIVETTESMTESIQSLKNKIQILTNEVEDEEQDMKQVFHIDNNKVLALPELSQKSLKAPILQKEILALIPNQNALLKDLNVLHDSAPVKNVSEFIEEAYRKLDGS